MGSVFGKETVAEPAFDVLLSRAGTDYNVQTTYEIRKYGERFAAEVSYTNPNDVNSSFGTLARYIGVFGTPENEGGISISMTAPVVMTGSSSSVNNDANHPKGGGTPIAMTAPVVIENENNKNGETKKMKFILPAEYDELSKIPKPTNSDVHIEEIPSQFGAIHRFSGFRSEDVNREMAASLGKQLQQDGVLGVNEDYAVQNYQFFGYNPPFTLPMFRRNEIWIELTQTQVDELLNKFNVKATN